MPLGNTEFAKKQVKSHLRHSQRVWKKKTPALWEQQIDTEKKNY